MDRAPAPRQRLLLRAGLVLGMLLAGAALWWVWQGSPLARDDAGPPPLPADTSRHVRVRDQDGAVIPGAAAFVLQTASHPVEAAWHPEQGVLVLPRGGVDHPVRVTAPGHRVEDAPAVRGGQTIIVRRGFVARVPLRGVPPDGIPPHVRFLLRVTPEDVRARGLEPQDLVDLMDNLGGPDSGPSHIPRGAFGYPLSREQAAAGILLPAPGLYRVTWGLIDTKAGTWYGLREGAGRTFEVTDAPTQADAPEAFPLDVTVEQLQETLDELARGVLAAKAMKVSGR